MKYANAKDIPTYLEAIPPDRRQAIESVIELIKKVAPKVGETFQYGMPFYPLFGEPMFAVASQKHFMAIYITEHDLVEKFKDKLGRVNLGKSCIRFKKESDLRWDMLERLLSRSYERRLENPT